jgi:hypothetical protein
MATDTGFKCICPAGTLDESGDGSRCTMGDRCDNPIVIDPAAVAVTLPALRLEWDTSKNGNHASFPPSTCPGAPMGGGAQSNDTIYSITPLATGNYTFTLSPSTFEGFVYVADNCGMPIQNCLGGAQTLGSTRVKLMANTTYYVFVDGAGINAMTGGAFALDVIRDPVQIDVTSVLTQDTVLNDSEGKLDPTQDPMDIHLNYLATESAMKALDSSGGVPDDAFFAATKDNPNVQLHWDNASDGPNARAIHPNQGPTTFSFDVPEHSYEHFQVYMVSTDGDSTVDFTLTYSDNSSDMQKMVVRDWFFPPEANATLLVAGLRQVSSSGPNLNAGATISAVNLKTDPSKILSKVVIWKEPGAQSIVFFGASAW